MHSWKYPLIVVMLVLSLAGFFYGLNWVQGTDLRESLVDREKLALSTPKIRNDLDQLMASAPLVTALNSLKINDPMMNAQQGISQFLKNYHNTYPLDLSVPSADKLWLSIPMPALYLWDSVSLFRQLNAYSYWNIEAPVENAPFSASLDLKKLHHIVRLSLRSAESSPHLKKEAIRGVYHLALLALSSQHLPIVIEGLKWLDDLRNFFDLQVQPVPMPALYVEEYRLTHYAKALWAASAFIDWTVDEQLFSSLFSYRDRDSLVLCTALHERIPTLRMERQYLMSLHPVEFNELDRRIKKIKPLCRPTPTLELWEQSTEPALARGSPSSHKAFSTLAAFVFGQIQRPDYLQAY